MKKNLTAVIFGLAIIVAAIVLGNAYANRNKLDGKIQVRDVTQVLGCTTHTRLIVADPGMF